jgi:Uma2 family endonuclease
MTPPPATLIEYPCSDGQPMSDNTKQARWIFTLFGGLLAEFRHREDVFVAADNLWYPVEGEPTIRVAPDVYVVFGRPKGDRMSYLQWEENNIPLTVVFEVLSPSNTVREMDNKLLFYDEHGVEEYYSYDPDSDELKVWIRGQATLARVRFQDQFTSPRLGIRFDLTGPEMRVFQSNGDPFLTYDQLKTLQEQEHARAEQERQRAEEERARADKERARADEAERQLELQRERLRLYRQLSRLALVGQATPEQLAQLDQLDRELQADSD